MYSKIIKIFFLFLLMLLAIFSFIIGLPKNGQVIDSVTKQPIQGIRVTRDIFVYVPCGEFGSSRCGVAKERSTIFTDLHGRYYFPFYLGFKFPFQRHSDYLNVGYGAIGGEPIGAWRSESCEDNTGYIAESTDKSQPTVTPIFWLKTNTNFTLAPVVDDKNKCDADSKCLSQNNDKGRWCMYNDDDCSCVFFHEHGGRILESTSNDFVLCNIATDEKSNKQVTISSEVKALQCFKQSSVYRYEQPTIESCSSINSRFAKDYCFWRVAELTQFADSKVCDGISKEQYTNEELAALNKVFDFSDYIYEPLLRHYENGLYNECIETYEYYKRQKRIN